MKISQIIPLLLIFILIGCKESIVGPIEDDANSDYYTITAGSFYIYNSTVYDSNSVLQSGLRKSYFVGDTILLNTTYQTKIDTFQLNSVETIVKSYLRKSSTGVFNYVNIDTAGFSGLIPDSLQGAISFDSEYRLLYQPLDINQNWPVFKVTASYSIFQFDLFSIDASVISKDSLTFAFRDTTFSQEVYKIKYSAQLFTNINQPPINYELYAWIGNKIGFVKWEGTAELINFFAGANIYPLESVVLENLNAYKIK